MALNILVYEYLSGGGCVGGEIPQETLCEGYAMLRGLISDLKAAGNRVTTILDQRLARLKPPLEADHVFEASSRTEFPSNLERSYGLVDAAILVAPESDGTLQGFVREIENLKVKSLNCSSEAIGKASNKIEMYELLRRKGFQTPETVIIDLGDDDETIKKMFYELGFPSVVKPSLGVGCLGLNLLTSRKDVEHAVKNLKKRNLSSVAVAQRLVRGLAASVSLISTGGNVSAVTHNRQIVKLAKPGLKSSYMGGFTPFHHRMEGEAMKLACRVVEAIRGLRGYIGVDMVLSEDKPYVVEVNPRVTTSYIGLRKVVCFNPAQAILDAVLKKKLPKEACLQGCSFFMKVETTRPNHRKLAETYSLEEVASPPLPVSAGNPYAMLVTYSKTLRAAKNRFNQMRNLLQKTLGEA